MTLSVEHRSRCLDPATTVAPVFGWIRMLSQSLQSNHFPVFFYLIGKKASKENGQVIILAVFLFNPPNFCFDCVDFFVRIVHEGGSCPRDNPNSSRFLQFLLLSILDFFFISSSDSLSSCFSSPSSLPFTFSHFCRLSSCCIFFLVVQ